MADYYISIFYSEEDEGYIADIPDLPGCSAFGDTPQEALQEVLIAKRLWLDVAREKGRDPGTTVPACYLPGPPIDPDCGATVADNRIHVFYSDEDEGYIAEIPDLPGCSTFGRTPEEALTELRIAKQA